MGFRIMQLQYEKTKKGANIEDGITLELPLQTIDLGFGQIQSLFTPSGRELRVTSIYDYGVEEKDDGFKNVKIDPGYRPNVIEEKGILLVIRYVDLIEGSGLKRIAGRYPGEGIYLLKPNDKITVTRCGVTEKFAALQFENKMYLVKVHKN